MEQLLNYEIDEIRENNFECFYYGIKQNKYNNLSEYTNSDGMYNLLANNHIKYKYEILEKLGRGQYGVVAKVLDHQTNKKMALKIIRAVKKYKFSYENEVQNILFLRSKLLENEDKFKFLIPNIDDYFIFRNHFVIVFDLYQDNLYESIIKPKKILPFNYIKIIINDLIETLVYLRKYKIIHGDIKPENILFRKQNCWNIMLVDYGLSLKDYDNNNYTLQSIWYRAPEIIFKIPYDFRIDLWSVGCILYELYIGVAPFRAKTEYDLLKEMQKKIGKPSDEFIKYVNNCPDLTNQRLDVNYFYECLKQRWYYNIDQFRIQPIKEDIQDNYIIEILKGIFVYNPNNRITYESILNHPFLKDIKESEFQEISLVEEEKPPIPKRRGRKLMNIKF